MATPSDSDKKNVIGCFGVLAILLVVFVLGAMDSCNNARLDSMVADDARAQKDEHIQKLAWQAAHPKEWAALKARQRRDAARDLAQRKAAAQHTPCKEFGRALDSVDAGYIASSYDCRMIGGAFLIHITIRDSAWVILDYDRRLSLAKGLWAGCVKFANPAAADDCHVRLVGEAGEDLGGSNLIIGSMIDVSKD